MKYFRSEGPVHYSQYKFSYYNWAQLGDGECPGAAYPDGYLPYSGNTKDARHLFYMARSLRVRLEDFSMEKKRRYDHRGWKAFGLSRKLMEKPAFLEKYGTLAPDLAQKWMAPRFGDKALRRERLAYILQKPYLRHILTWTLKEELAAFALIVRGSWGAHYWYVFYRNGSGLISPPGHGYLVDFLEWCQAEDLPHAYVGTAYGRKSRYKSRGLNGVEFWDGNGWNPDKEDLKRRQEDD